MFLPWAPRPRVARSAVVRLGAALWSVAACGDGAREAPRTPAGGAPAPMVRAAGVEITDDGGRVVRLAAPARRVISLIPSATETLVALGAANAVVGRTRYDVAPEIASRPSVGGGLDPSVEAIVGLRPDVVIGWDNDKRQAVREKLTAAGVPVVSLRTDDTTDVFRNVATLGRLTGRDSAAAALQRSLRAELDEVRRSVAGRPTPSVFYVVFNDPPMTAGPQTFIGQLIGLAGGRSAFPDVRQPWPTVSMEELVRRQPDVVVLPVGEFVSNAADRLRGRAGWRELRAVRDGRVVTVPANLANRPGPHLGEAARALRAALHPELAATTARSAVAGTTEGARP